MEAHDGPSAADIVIVDTLDESDARHRQCLEIRRSRCSDVGEARDALAHTVLIDVTAIVEFPSHHAQSEYAVDDGQIDFAVDIVVAAGVRGLRAFHGHIAAEIVEIRRIGYETNRTAHGTRAVQRTLGSAQYLNAIHIVQTDVRFKP